MKPMTLKPQKDFAVLQILENYNVKQKLAIIVLTSGRILLLIQTRQNMYFFSFKFDQTWMELMTSSLGQLTYFKTLIQISETKRDLSKQLKRDFPSYRVYLLMFIWLIKSVLSKRYDNSLSLRRQLKQRQCKSCFREFRV